jgi:hypothetical protein
MKDLNAFDSFIVSVIYSSEKTYGKNKECHEKC